MFVGMINELSHAVKTTAHPGHTENPVSRKVVDGKIGKITMLDIPWLVLYNRFMGGADKSEYCVSVLSLHIESTDSMIQQSYVTRIHDVLRKTSLY